MPTTTVTKTKLIKILQITPFYTPHLGGVETHVKAINHELIKQGYQVSVLTQRHRHDLPTQEVIDGVKVTRLDIESEPLNKLIEKLVIWRQMARQARLLLEADIIQVHDVYWWLLPLLPLFWSKIYLTFHGWEGQFPVPLSHQITRQWWSKLALKTVHVGRYIQDFYGDKPDLVIYGGTSLRRSWFQKTKSRQLQIVFVGRLEAENDLEQYLALAKILSSILDVKITWVGDGSYKAECQKFGVVTGMIKNPASYTAAADLVWSASYLSILAAQAQGKIVAAFYSHQLKERYLKSYPGSKYMLIGCHPVQLAWQILQLLTKPIVLKTYSNHAQRWARQQTWQKIADQYQQLWGVI